MLLHENPLLTVRVDRPVAPDGGPGRESDFGAEGEARASLGYQPHMAVGRTEVDAAVWLLRRGARLRRNLAEAGLLLEATRTATAKIHTEVVEP